MDARRLRIVVCAAVAAGLITGTLVAPAAAADCALSAPDTVNVGTQLTIEGTGFPASSSVDIAITIEDGAADEFSVQTNAGGAFQINLAPENAETGSTTVVAMAGTACSAQVTYLVLAAGQTAPPTSEPAESPGAAGSGPDAPRTDVDDSRDEGADSGAWALTLLVLVFGAAGLFSTRTRATR
jgi:hypothetical protein